MKKIQTTFSTETKLRVRYAETDKMGYVYYGNYAIYFEVGRVEAMKKLGISYREMEENGYMMPVIDYNTNYYKPVFYDEEITIITTIKEIPKTRIRFDYECYKENGELANKAYTTLVFVNKKTNKPTLAPASLVKELLNWISE